MKKVFIKYNTYKIETEIKVDGKSLAGNSVIREKIENNARMQEWIEELPNLLIEEFNDKDFEVVFHGTIMDYEDLVEVFTGAYNKGKLTAKLDRKPAKETSDKEELIDFVFEEIQAGPFDELRNKSIIDAFEQAKSEEVEVIVVATMSAGKSTLINAMLADKLMPSKQEACTAIITRIKDNNDENNLWKAKVYDRDERLIKSYENLDLEIMNRLNSDDNVSQIKIKGDIPFLSSEDMSLVLIDTPGPNNSRNPEHRKTQSEFLQSKSKSLVLYIMESTFGSDDDNALLERVAESMKVGGKQSRDRFIFVVNKMDGRRAEDGNTEDTLTRVKEYLKDHGIENPNLFPAAALPALNIRLMDKGIEIDEDTIDETEMIIRRLNRNNSMHFESYASLPKSIKDDINLHLERAKENENTNKEALIHTGVLSIEAGIRQYVQKYAKTHKIKTIVDTFMKKLEEVGALEETKKELAQHQDNSERITKTIKVIRQKLDDTKLAKKFKDSVDDAVIKVSNDSKQVVENITQKYQAVIRKKIDSFRDEKLSMDEVEYEMERLGKFVARLEPDFQVELDELIREDLIRTNDTLLEQYKKKLISLTENIDFDNLMGISIDPLKLMGGSIDIGLDRGTLQKLEEKKEVEDGEEWVSNTSKRWYKPWTWLQESGYYRTKYKTVTYIKGEELAEIFFAPVNKNIIENGRMASKYALKESNRIAKDLNEKLKLLDNILKEKLQELEDFVTEKDKVEERIKETERKLAWLEDIKDKVEEILEI